MDFHNNNGGGTRSDDSLHLPSVRSGVRTPGAGIAKQLGLTLIEAGYSRVCSFQAVLVKNFYQLGVGIVVFWLLGYGFGTGGVDQGFLGDHLFAGQDWDNSLHYLNCALYGFLGMIVVFSVNNPITERVQLPVYLLFTLFIMFLIYPVILAWTWSSGWLTDFAFPVLDYGGTGTIHLLAGSISLAALIMVGPRTGRVERGPSDPEFFAADYSLITVGVLLFSIGLFVVNTYRAESLLEVGRGLFNSWLSGGACAIVTTILGTFNMQQMRLHLDASLQGFLGGVIAVGAVGQSTDGWDALCIGSFVGVFTALTIRYLRTSFLDDVTGTVAWQLVPGALGLILAGFFDNEKGVFHHGNGEQVGYQCLAVAVIFAWGALFGAAFFGGMWKLGILRVNEDLEVQGLSTSEVDFPGFTAPKTLGEELSD